ncbi:S4 domain-containing protein [Litorivicinus sp.]|nr:S4 domain-containing protein [Litorivicinus sp.]
MSGVRLDKWLWAARFFKTRGLARSAIDGGKIRIEGNKAKPSKLVTTGLLIKVSRGQTEIEVEILGVREDRRPATEAAWLYQETNESCKKREAESDMRRFALKGFQPSDQRPSKHARKELNKLKGQTE